MDNNSNFDITSTHLPPTMHSNIAFLSGLSTKARSMGGDKMWGAAAGDEDADAVESIIISISQL